MMKFEIGPSEVKLYPSQQEKSSILRASTTNFGIEMSWYFDFSLFQESLILNPLNPLNRKKFHSFVSSRK